MNILQNFIYPQNLDVGSKEKYLRVEGGVYFENGILEMTKFSNVEFDTYYNAFSVPLWQQKVGIDRIFFQISGQGKVKIELYHLKKNEAVEVKEVKMVDLTEQSQIVFDFSITNEFEYSGLIYPKVIAMEDVTITAMNWKTKDVIRRQVKLGISITHFDRKAYIIPAIKRIKGNLLDDTEWHEKIDFVVIDNSQNITEDEALGIKVIPNENTGGSGGFTRGLLYYKNETDATHVLFMDDDASLEVESIKRAYTILEYAEKENSTVGAALFYEETPNLLIERGARLHERHTWRPKFHDQDVLEVKNILEEEMNEEPDDYAAWWFCAFPIKYAEKLSLPYFVRADDVSFGALNDLNLIYANGIACMGENFAYKVSPMTIYLDMRNKLIAHTLFINKPWYAARYYLGNVGRLVLAIRHGYVNVSRLALKDYLHLTPEWLIENENMKAILPQLKELVKDNDPHDINLQDYPLIKTNKKDESKLKKIGRMLTLNRLLTPLEKNKVIFQEFIERPIYRQVAGYKKILYYNPETDKGFVVEATRGKVIREIFGLLMDSLKLLFKYRSIRKRLLNNLDNLTSEEMWKKILKIDADK